MKYIKAAFFLLCLFTLISCKPLLLPIPNIETEKESNSQSKTTDAPVGFEASQGLKQKIELTWQKNPKAKCYYIYGAETPYGEFIQVGETGENTASIVFQVPAGTDTYYRICSVFYDGTRSRLSAIVRGTSLANPLISSIEPADDADTSATVYWWMNNADKSTYAEKLRYTVHCYAKTSGIETALVTVDGSSAEETKAVFNNLQPHTEYFFTVEACTIDFQNDTEISDRMDTETARRLRPDAPENLSITQGTEQTKINVRFSLPALTDVAQGGNTFKKHPLYFKIFRKVANTNEDFIPIKDKLRPKPLTSYAVPDKPTLEELLNAYIPDAVLEWVDDGDEDTQKDVVRGVQYEYRVQAYVDGAKREISSNLSCAQAVGWARAVPVLKVKDFYEENSDKTAFTKASFKFDLSWDSLGKETDYAFVLSEIRYKFPDDNGGNSDTTGTEQLKRIFTSQTELNSFVHTIDISPDDDSAVRGYYSYNLYFVPSDYSVQEIPSEPTEKLTSGQKFFVTRNHDIPDKADFNFTLQDGFKDKVELSWKYDETCTYNLIYYPTGNPAGIQPIIDLSSAITPSTQNGEKVTYTHRVASGMSYDYILRAKKGVEVESEPLSAQALGTPKPNFDEQNADYDSVTVTWKAVQKADSYRLTFTDTYNQTVICEGSTSIEALTVKKDSPEAPYTVDKPAVADLSYNDSDKTFTCTLKKPKGYDDAKISGTDIQASVTARNDSTSDEITTPITARTLGPALAAVQATDASDNSKIIVTWKAVAGAKGYIVKRVCKDFDGTSKINIYVIDGKNGSVTADSSETTTERVSVNPTFQPGVIRMEDKYAPVPAENVSTWHACQEKIGWGVEYVYTVFPVKNVQDGFDKDTDTLKEITYTNVVGDSGSALGYGYKIKASKAESPDSIEITWEKPFLGVNAAMEPTLWKRETGTAAAWEPVSVPVDASGTKFVFKPRDTNGERFKAFDFIVSYKRFNAAPLQSFVARTEELKDPIVSDKEALNKGYLFSVRFKAENQPENGQIGFNERLSWELYNNTAERAAGPVSKYKILIKNNDYGADWQEIAQADPLSGAITLTAEKSDWAVDREKKENALIVKPRMTSGAHSGLLQVLRDYRHFAKLEVSRTNSKGETIYASFSDNEANCYTYRQISDKELALMATMALTHGLKTQLPKRSSWHTLQNTNTNPAIYTDWKAFVWKFTYKDYKLFLVSVDGLLVAATKAAHQYPRYYGSMWSGWDPKPQNNKITITGPTDAPVEIKNAYSGILTISALAQNGSGKLTITRNEKESTHLGNITPLIFEDHSGYPTYNDWTTSEGWK